MATDHYRSAELIFGWSFYRQGSSSETSSADEFLDGALTWFGDPDPRLGTAWEKGERLAKLIAHRRSLLILDVLEPLQNPPGPQEGRLRQPSIQALLRELASFSTEECNKRLYDYYRTLAPQLPETFRDMEPLFLAVISGCKAGLFHAALHDVYLPRIQRGNTSFAANVLSARGALLSALAHFFERGDWGSPFETAEGQCLTAEDQLFILMEAGHLITVIRGMGAPEAGLCYGRAESLARSLKCFPSFYMVLVGQWRHSLNTAKLSVTLQIAKRLYALAQEQNDSSLLIGACTALACTLYFLGDFETSGQYATRGIQLLR